jgi:hypothetical protein
VELDRIKLTSLFRKVEKLGKPLPLMFNSMAGEFEKLVFANGVAPAVADLAKSASGLTDSTESDSTDPIYIGLNGVIGVFTPYPGQSSSITSSNKDAASAEQQSAVATGFEHRSSFLQGYVGSLDESLQID